MIRVVFFLLVVAAFAAGFVWIADRPGDVTIVWLGQRVDTSVMVLVCAVATLAAAAVFVWSLAAAIVRSPRRMGRSLGDRRTARGQRAISRGLIAIGSGNVPAARRHAAEAQRLAPSEPLALLLAAQSAQLAGDHLGAERAFRLMAAHDDTKLIGLNGLFTEARQRNDAGAARLYAEEAARVAPALPWAAHAVLDLRAAEGEWTAALGALDTSMRHGVIDKATFRRQRAVLLTALAMHETDREVAKAAAVDATKLAPGLVPAAVAAGRFLSDARETRRASRILEAAWRANPHPDVADAYADVNSGDSALARLARVRALAKLRPDSDESAIAVARAALDAQEFAAARETLTPLLPRLTQRVALLMAELEDRESGDVGRARQWTTRAVHAARDPAWTADGVTAETWAPLSPVTGRLDAFEWKAPPAEFGPKGLSFDADAPLAPASDAPPASGNFSRMPVEAAHDAPAAAEIARSEDETASPASAPAASAQVPAPSAASVAVAPPATATAAAEPISPPRAAEFVAEPAAAPSTPPPPLASPANAPSNAAPPAAATARATIQPFPKQPVIGPVIPLVHAPDDPGPENEAETETDATPNWQKMRSLFR